MAYIKDKENIDISKGKATSYKQGKSNEALRWLFSRKSAGHQNSMALPKKQMHRSMELNREPRNESTIIWAMNLWQMRQEYIMIKDSLFNKRFWENWTATYKKKNQTGLLSHTIYKNKLNMDWRLKCKPKTIKLLEENISSKFFDMVLVIFFTYLLE